LKLALFDNQSLTYYNQLLTDDQIADRQSWQVSLPGGRSLCTLSSFDVCSVWELNVNDP